MTRFAKTVLNLPLVFVALGPALLQPGTAVPGGFRSGEPWRDTDGNVIDAHGAGMLLHDSTYYWYGSRRTTNASGTQMDGGIALYSSADLYTWRFESVVLHVFNCTSNDTSRPGSSSYGGSGLEYPPPSCANGNGLDLERPKVVQCGGPGSGGKFVMWVRGTGFGNSPQLLTVLESDHPTGPFSFVSNRTGSDDPFHTIAPGIANLPAGYQYADATLFQDPRPPHKTFVYWRTRMTKGVDGTSTGFRAMELTENCHDVRPSSDTQVTLTPNREGPAMFYHEGSYFLWVSGTMGWAPTAMYVYEARSPLGNFSASSMDEHYWHAYTKGDTGNSTAWNGTWTVHSGYLLVGPPYGNHSADGNGGADGLQTTFAAAKALCAQGAGCAGFTFIDFHAAPSDGTMLKVSFKSKVVLYPEKEVGLQPPPIPVPGHVGNECGSEMNVLASGDATDTTSDRPCEWAFDSQSTYILPNPHYNVTTGFKLPPFIYMGDRWNYSNVYGTSTATYVWLPLFVRPRPQANRGKSTTSRHTARATTSIEMARGAPNADANATTLVQVVWRDEWRLDDESMYPF